MAKMKEQQLADKVAHQVKKIHGANTDSQVLAHQGVTLFFNRPSDLFPPGNPVTATGSQVMRSMKKQYGKRGKQVFYASIQKGVPGSKKWHR